MQVEQYQWTVGKGWSQTPSDSISKQVQLVLAFGSREQLEDAEAFGELRKQFPSAHIASCSTSGEIVDTEIFDETIAVTAVKFDKTEVKVGKVDVREFENSEEAGKALANKLALDGLRHVFVLSDGHLVNGSALVRGLNSVIPSKIGVTGGLAGDADRFTKTLVGLDAPASEGTVAAVGFYGETLRIGFGSLGGWDPFGPLRRVTKAVDNVLYELDGSSALEIYKKYLGDKADGLPGTGLLFPLSLQVDGVEETLVRTILSINEEEGSMTFAGEIPEGSTVQLMRANFDRLIDGAATAADQCRDRLGEDSPGLAVCISCVGRRLVLGQRTEDEVEGVRDSLGPVPKITGFYSYGEISPFTVTTDCRLHNQTMTITTFAE